MPNHRSMRSRPWMPCHPARRNESRREKTCCSVLVTNKAGGVEIARQRVPAANWLGPARRCRCRCPFPLSRGGTASCAHARLHDGAHARLARQRVHVRLAQLSQLLLLALVLLAHGLRLWHTAAWHVATPGTSQDPTRRGGPRDSDLTDKQYPTTLISRP